MTSQRIEVPDIGDAEGVDVVEVLVREGARLERDQGVIVLESDKASMEVPSPAAGVVRGIAVKVGDKVSKGSLIAMLETDEAAAAAAPATATVAKPAPPAPPAASRPASAPAAAKSAPAPTQPPMAIEAAAAAGSDKIEDDAAFESLNVVRAPGSNGSNGSSAVPMATRTVPPPPPPPRESLPPEPRAKLPHATPSLRRFARELGVDLRQLSGTGPHGRITREDVQRYVKHAMSIAGTETGNGFAFPELPEIDFSQFGETTLQPLTKIQKLSGRNLHRSWVTIPHVTQHDEADITELEAFRHKMRAERPDVKLTITAFFVKALAVVLKQMPRFNASLDKSGESLILKKYFHIGVAVDTPGGLVVPVIRDVDLKGIADIAIELSAISERARSRRLTTQDMQGACMTISSLGGIGGTQFTPIINPPEVAVLGVSRAAQKPVYIDGKLEPRLMVGLSLSYDHRVIDGADGARFTTRLREVLSDIRQMLL